MDTLYATPVWQIGLLLFGLLIAAIECGHAIGRRADHRSKDGPSGTYLSVMGAVLGLLSLLLGFSYSMAVSRYDQHKALLIHEVNAIGTVYLRSNLLDETAGLQMRNLLRALVAVRLAQHDERIDLAQEEKDAATEEQLRTTLWKLVTAESRRNPDSLSAAQVLQSVNDLIDAGAARTAYYQNHVPEVILVMLLAVALVSSLLIGFAFGAADKRNPIATFVFATTLAVVVFTLLDLDRPRRGLIRTGQLTMRSLQSSLEQ
jgi:hypothetical protein